MVSVAELRVTCMSSVQYRPSGVMNNLDSSSTASDAAVEVGMTETKNSRTAKRASVVLLIDITLTGIGLKLARAIRCWHHYIKVLERGLIHFFGSL
jgi:hypothetical protein